MWRIALGDYAAVHLAARDEKVHIRGHRIVCVLVYGECSHTRVSPSLMSRGEQPPAFPIPAAVRLRTGRDPEAGA